MRREIIRYNPCLKEKARKLRNHSTEAEIILWKKIRKKKIMGYDFHRQKPLYEYIVDFYCNELNLAIEVDGKSHNGRELEDQERQSFLAIKGIKMLRFNNSEVIADADKVINKIEDWIKSKNNSWK